MARRALHLVVVVGLAALAVGMGASAASAHAQLVRTEPAASSVVDESPRAIVLDFDEEVEVGLGGISLYDATGKSIDIGPAGSVAGDPSQVHASVPGLSDGTFVVAWRVVSADSHPVQGAFTFTVGSGGALPPGLLERLLANGGGSGVLGVTLGAARWLLYAGAALLLGSLVFLAFVWPDAPAPGRRRLRAASWGGWGAAVIASVTILLVQGPYASGKPVGDAVSLADEVLATRLGRAIEARLFVLVAFAALLVALRPAARWFRLAVVVAGAGLGVSLAWGGHAATGRLPALGVTADAAHVVGMAVWLGGLVALLLVTFGSSRAPTMSVGAAVASRARDESMAVGDPGPSAATDPRAAVGRFSSMALVAVAVIVTSGVVQAWRILGGISELTGTRYGRLLLVKVVVVVVMIVLAALARQALRRRRPLESVRRSVVGEVVFGAAVLVMSATLVGTSPVSADGGVFSVTMVQQDVLTQLVVDPARAGPNEIHIYVSLPGGSLQRAEEITARMTLPSRDLGPIPIPLAPAGVNHMIGSAVDIPYPGDWEFEILVRTTQFDQQRFATSVPIR